jgi:hypothetical protein
MAIFHALSGVVSVSEVKTQRQLGFGTSRGQVIFATLHNFRFGTPIITATRLWLWDIRSQNGRWDECLTALCEHCGQRFEPEPSVLDVIHGITAHLNPDQLPCLSLPCEAWDEPRLLSACPHCHKPVKFNPFVVDNQDVVMDNRTVYDVYERGLLASLLRLFRRKDRP